MINGLAPIMLRSVAVTTHLAAGQAVHGRPGKDDPTPDPNGGTGQSPRSTLW